MRIGEGIIYKDLKWAKMKFSGKDFEQSVYDRLSKIYKNLDFSIATEDKDFFLGIDLYLKGTYAVDITVDNPKKRKDNNNNNKKCCCSQRFRYNDSVSVCYRYGNGKIRFPSPVLVVEFKKAYIYSNVRDAAIAACADLAQLYQDLDKVCNALDSKAIEPEESKNLPPYDGVKKIFWDGSKFYGF